MVKLQQYLKSNSGLINTQPMPFLNSLFVQQFSSFSPYGKDVSFKTFIKWMRKSPQLMGFLGVIASDIISDSITFEPMVPSTSGRNKVLKAKAFWKANNGLEILEETLYDLLGVGIGYNWKGVLSETQLKEFCETIAINIEAGGYELKAQALFDRIQQEVPSAMAKKFRYIAASTVTINTDAYEPVNYIQRVGTHTKIFDPDEIMVFKFMPFDGQVYPFPPMEALLSEVYLLWLISQNYVSLFENGGHPDKVFILPQEMAGSKNHQFLINTLKKYKKIQNKHGNLVFTGDIKIEDMMKVESQMQNKDLGLYLVGVLAMFYGVPAGRIPFLIGKAANLGDAGGLADSGYWRKISVLQSKVENTYNRDLWNPYFGVNMKFARGYKQDEVRETTTEMQKNNIAEQRMELGLWTVESAGDYLGIDREEIVKAQAQKERREEEVRSHMLNQNLETQSNALDEPDKKKKNKEKQDTQLKSQEKKGGKNIRP